MYLVGKPAVNFFMSHMDRIAFEEVSNWNVDTNSWESDHPGRSNSWIWHFLDESSWDIYFSISMFLVSLYIKQEWWYFIGFWAEKNKRVHVSYISYTGNTQQGLINIHFLFEKLIETVSCRARAWARRGVPGTQNVKETSVRCQPCTSS